MMRCFSRSIATSAANGLFTRNAVRMTRSPIGTTPVSLSAARYRELGDEPLAGDFKGLERMRSRYGERWPAALGTLLQLASGRLSLGQADEASAVLAEARSLLIPARPAPGTPLKQVERIRLASAYARAVG